MNKTSHLSRLGLITSLFSTRILSWILLLTLNLVSWRAFQVLGQIDLEEIIPVALEVILWQIVSIFVFWLIFNRKLFAALSGGLSVLFYFAASYLTVGFHLRFSHKTGISEYAFYWGLFAAGIIGFVVLLYFLYHFTAKGQQEKTDKILRMLIFILIFEGLYTGGNLLWYYPQYGDFSKQKAHFTTIKEGELPKHFPPTDSLPDIYFLLFDEMMGPSVLTFYGDSISGNWYKNLREKGFFTADSACSNYAFTIQSMPSVFNMNYAEVQSKAVEWNHLLIKEAKVPAILRKAGYEVNAYSMFEFEGTPRHPESRDYIGSYHSFREYFYNRGYLQALREMIRSVKPKNDIYFNLNQVKKLSNTQSTRPRFNYIHFLMPHGPFILDEKGNLLSSQVLASRSPEKNVISQVHFTYNELILTCIKEIQENNKRPAVIVITGDHGVRLDEYHLPGGTTKQRYQIFHIVYYPDQAYESYPKNHSLANTFRFIFNKYLGTKYPTLPHQSFTKEGEKVPIDSIR